MPERVGQVVPEPVLELVHQREEPRGDQRRGEPDGRAQEDQPEIGASGEPGFLEGSSRCGGGLDDVGLVVRALGAHRGVEHLAHVRRVDEGLELERAAQEPAVSIASLPTPKRRSKASGGA